jgi:SnoaL-like domain
MRALAVGFAAALTAALTTAVPTVEGMSAATGGEGSRHRSCDERFDQAQRQDMESFRDYDAEAFRDVHHPDATSVFAVGEVAIGRDAIMEALAPYFEAQTSTWSWTEITRSVQGCRTGVIVYRTLIERPGFSRHAINTVTYTYEHGRFLAISDQGTEVAAPAE